MERHQAVSKRSRLAGLVVVFFVWGAAACGGPTSYRQADRRPVSRVCPDASGDGGFEFFPEDGSCEMERLTMEAACEAGDGLACGLAAMQWWGRSDTWVESEWRRARRWAERGCRRDASFACFWEARLSAIGPDEDARRRGRIRLKRSCSGGDGLACAFMARVVAFQSGGLKNPKTLQRARGFARRGCEAESPLACRYLARFWMPPEAPGESKSGTADAKKVSKYRRRACKLGDGESCRALDDGARAEKMGRRYVYGGYRLRWSRYVRAGQRACEAGFEHACAFVAREVIAVGLEGQVGERAVEMARTGCEAGSPASCLTLGHFRELWTVPGDQDFEAARNHYRRACRAGLKQGCEGQKRVAKHLKTRVKWRETLERCGQQDEKLEDPEACASAGAELLAGIEIERDVDRALKVGRAACGAEVGLGCQVAGEALWDEGRHRESVVTYQRGCELEDAMSCLVVGNFYRKGMVVEKDRAEALPHFIDACRYGNAEGCAEAGVILESDDGELRDPEAARRWAERGCRELEGAWSCSQLAIFEREGIGGPTNLEAARGHARTACEKGNAVACNILGVMLKHGQGGKRDRERGLELYRKACEQKLPNGCYNLGNHYRRVSAEARDLQEARKYYERACRLGKAKGCRNAAELHRKAGGEEHLRAAYRYFEHACRSGLSGACHEAGRALLNGRGVARDEKAGRERLREACRDGVGRACTAVAGASVEAGFQRESAERAMRWYERGCRAGHAPACKQAIQIVDSGVLEGRKFDRELSILRAACAGGVRKQCRRYMAYRQERFGLPEPDRPLLGLYESRCTAGHPFACERASQLHLLGAVGPVRPERARHYWQRLVEVDRSVCAETGNPYNCSALIAERAHPRAGGAAERKARELADRMCSDGRTAVCLYRARARLTGRIFERDLAAGSTTLESACAEGREHACLHLGRWRLGRAKKPAQARRAVEAWRRGCEQGSVAACKELGWARSVGLVGEADLDAGMKRMESGCGANRIVSCRPRATATMVHRRPAPTVLAILRARCQNNDPAACVEYGRWLDAGFLVAQNRSTARQLFEVTCRAGKAVGCAMGGASSANRQASAAELEPACRDDRDGGACLARALRIERTSGGWEDTRRAAGWYRRACEAGRFEGCVMVTYLDHDGQGPVYGAGEGEYLERACDIGPGAACRRAYRHLRTVDWPGAVALLRKGCSKGDRAACRELVDIGEASDAELRKARR